jgi:hypothetical protein
MNATLSRITLPALLLLAGCLENEEDIVVRADGSVEVTVRAKGDPADLADGYAVPLALPWRPASPDAERWLAEVGADTGSAAVQTRAVEVAWPTPPGEDRPQADLAVTRSFDSVEAWPRWLAPESEPYRTAYLERSATLEIRRAGAKRVYVFERTYHGKDFAALDFLHDVDKELPELEGRWDDGAPFQPEEWTRLRDVLARRQADAGQRFIDDALLGLYTQGDASFPTERVAPLVAAVRAAVEAYVDVPRLQRLRELTTGAGGADENEVAQFDEYIAGYREVLRTTVARELAAAGLAGPTRNAVLFALEWGFTSCDHITDLADESFRVVLALPGTLVGGNYDQVADGKACWKFDGEALQNGNVTLRAVSVLE